MVGVNPGNSSLEWREFRVLCALLSKIGHHGGGDGASRRPVHPDISNLHTHELRRDGGAGLIGLSQGLGTPANFVTSNFNTYGTTTTASQLAVNVPGVATEGAGVLVGQGSVTLPSTQASDVVVTLASSNTGEAPVPAAVTVPAGQLSLNATITAQDAGNNTTTGFNGTATLNCGQPTKIVGNGTSSSTVLPLYTYYHDQRSQCIYLQSAIGAAGTIRGLSLNVTTLPGQTMNNWTIRMKHTALASYSTPSWESTGWTTVYQANQTISSTGLTTFTFSTPFVYDGVSNLMVDFSFNNSSWTSAGAVVYTTANATRSIHYYTDSGYGDPLTWSGTSPTPLSLRCDLHGHHLHRAGVHGPVHMDRHREERWRGGCRSHRFAEHSIRFRNGPTHGDGDRFHRGSLRRRAVSAGQGLRPVN